MKKTVSLILCLSLMICSAVFVSCGTEKKDGESTVMAYVLCEKENAYSLGLAANFKTAFEKGGGEVTMESFPAGTSGFSEYFEKAIDVEADVIFLPNSVAVAPDMLKTVADLGIDVPILAGDTWESSVILDAVKDKGIDVYCTTFFDENDTSEPAKEFVSGFKNFLSQNSDYYEMNGGNDMVAAVSALGFDAYNVAMDAIRTAAEKKGSAMTSVDIAKALWNTDYVGVTGSITFDNSGDAIKNNAYIKKAAADGTGFEFVKLQTVENNSKKAYSSGYTVEGVAIDSENKKIVVGAYEPTTGDDSAGGKQELLGIIYANFLDNTVVIDGEDYTVELFVSDNGSLEENALAAASKIVDEKAVVVIGSYGSGVSIAASDVFEEAAIPAIGASCTNPEVTSKSDFYFRSTVVDSFQGSVMADFAYTLIEE